MSTTRKVMKGSAMTGRSHTRAAVACGAVVVVAAALATGIAAPVAQAATRFKPGLPVNLGTRASGPAWPGAAPLPKDAPSHPIAPSPLAALTEPVTVSLGGASPTTPAAVPTTSSITPPAAVAAELGVGQWQSVGTTGLKLAPVAAVLPASAPIRATAGTGAVASAGGPVTVSVLTPSQAAAAGLSKSTLVFRVTSSGTGSQAGPLALTVPTAALAAVAGGDYASRARWIQLSDPANGGKTNLETAQPVGSTLTDNGRTAVLTPTTKTSSRSTLIAASAGTPNSASGTGDFSATPIKPSSQWDVSAQTGSFSWSEPLRVPPAAAGPAPDLSFAYSSNAIDGETGSTNNQSSSGIGDGWDLSGGGSISRSFATCAFDTPTGVQKQTSQADDTGDECWRTDNATLTLNGQSNVLVKGADGKWRLSNDDGSLVEHLTGGSAIGTWNHDYWRVTARNGTQYYFGANQIPGSAASSTPTNSVDYVPVYGNDSTEPCHATSFKDSACNQAWRWNLDYVIDTHQQSEAFYYTQETDSYTANSGPTSTGSSGANPTTQRPYIRASELSRVDYDMHAGTETTTAAPEQVVIDHDIRCMSPDSDGTAFNCGDHAQWQDTPFDQDCQNTPANCPTKTAPTFYSETRMTDIHTLLRSGTAYAEVDRWTLGQKFQQPGDGSVPLLWLGQITHSGSVGGTATLPSVTFKGTQLANRVKTSKTSGLAGQMKWRINLIQNESGGATGISYLSAGAAGGCDSSVVNQAPESNTTRCYPQWWTPPVTNGVTYQPETDWFVQYPVASVTVTPTTGGASAAQDQSNYTYSSPAWRYDTSPLVPDAKRTWSDFAGYGTVRVDHGDPNSPSTTQSTQYKFFQGLNGDRAASSGGTKSVTITASDGTTKVADERWWAGRTLESTVTNGVNGPKVSGVVTVPYGVQTGTDGTHVSEYADDSTVTTSTILSTGGPRVGITTYGHDALGRITSTEDNPDTNNTALERCTLTSFDDNTAEMLLSSVQETQTLAGACAGATTPASTPPAATLSDTRTSYDGAAFKAAPTHGDPSTSSALMALTPSVRWVTTTTKYDTLGRPTSLTAPLKPAVTTTYTPAASTTGNTAPLTKIAVKSAMGWTSSTNLNAAWGTVTAATDANNDTTTAAYDALGRVTAVWRANRAQATYPSAPSIKYAYTVSQTQPTTVETDVLDANSVYQKSFVLYDGMSRQVQTQAPSEGGGSIVTDTAYDAAGRVFTVDGAYASPNKPGTTLYLPPQPQNLPSQTRTMWDGAGRKVSEAFWSVNQQKWLTSYSYGGDRVSVTPPHGATPTTTIADARGQTTSLLQYHASTPAGTADTTTYSYTAAGKLQAMTDPVGHSWQWTYDLLGNTTSAVDPDTGTTTSGYDDAGRLSTTTDGRNQQLSYSYDNDDRKTAQYAGTVTTGTQLAAWTYDTKPDGSALPHGLGRPSTSTRYVSGAAFTEQVGGYNALGSPTSSSYVLPSVLGTLAATYTTTQEFAADGSVASTTEPAEGGIAAETISASYDAYGLMGALGNGTDYYAYTTSYDYLNRLAGTTAGSTVEVSTSRSYVTGTDRLSSFVFGEVEPSLSTVANDNYNYDDAGDVINETELSDDAIVPDEQCYSLDYLQRLTQAYTAKPTTGSAPGADCAVAASLTNLGGPAPYWQNYTYDAVGNRKTITRNGTSSTASSSTTTYAYPATATAAQPHGFTSTTTATTKPDGTTTTAAAQNYKYDAVGNSTVRPNQKLTWDATGRLSVLQVGSSTSNVQSNVYDADGNLLVRTDPTTGTTAYLGNTELHLTPGSSTATAVRTYSFLGQVVAERVSKTSGTPTLTWLAGDQHSSETSAVDDQTGAATHRYFDPFGSARGAAVPWQDDHGFLNASASSFDNLTHLGARDYDPTTGNFVSVDPLFSAGDPAQNVGYSYAHNNPATLTDPSGLEPRNPGQCFANDDACNSHPGTAPNRVTGGSFAAAPGGGDKKNVQRARDNRTKSIGVDNSSAVNAWAVGATTDTYTGNQTVELWGKNICFGRAACAAALTYWQTHNHDIAGAREVAANYCVDKPRACAAWNQQAQTAAEVLSLGYAAFAGGDAEYGDSATEDDSAADASAGCGESFAPQTEVVMGSGVKKRIDQVRVGDKLKSENLTTGETTTQTVTAVWLNSDSDLMNGQIEVNGVDAPLRATQHHLFWDESRSTWIELQKFPVGDSLRTDDGTQAILLSTTAVPGSSPMWDLTVANTHDFYVAVETTGVLVHNCPMLGEGGTQLNNMRILKDTGQGYRIDVENPAPGVRPGQLHLQRGSDKYIYNFDSEQWIPTPGSALMDNRLAKAIDNNPDVAVAIQKGANILNVP